MNQELVDKAQALFDSAEKWNAFMELHSAKDDIKFFWFKKMRIALTEYFYTTGRMSRWSSRGWDTWDMCWYVQEIGEDFMSLWFRDGNRLMLWVKPEKYNVAKVTELLKSEKYAELISQLRPDESFLGGNIISEIGNFEFGTAPHNGNFGVTHLSWHAGHDIKGFTDQLEEKVNRYRKSEKLTDLIIQLYNEPGVKK